MHVEYTLFELKVVYPKMLRLNWPNVGSDTDLEIKQTMINADSRLMWFVKMVDLQVENWIVSLAGRSRT